jgi:hypothetical protein
MQYFNFPSHVTVQELLLLRFNLLFMEEQLPDYLQLVSRLAPPLQWHLAAQLHRPSEQLQQEPQFSASGRKNRMDNHLVLGAMGPPPQLKLLLLRTGVSVEC